MRTSYIFIVVVKYFCKTLFLRPFRDVLNFNCYGKISSSRLNTYTFIYVFINVLILLISYAKNRFRDTK